MSFELNTRYAHTFMHLETILCFCAYFMYVSIHLVRNTAGHVHRNTIISWFCISLYLLSWWTSL